MVQTVQDMGKGTTRLDLYSQALVPLEQGIFLIQVYRHKVTKEECVAVLCFKGIKDFSVDQEIETIPFSTEEPTFVRVHSECFTGEALGSLKCDCKFQLDHALERISQIGEGIIIYLRQEGRGIGLGDKIKAYSLQNKGYDTLEANHMLGYPDDLRDFKLAADVLSNHLQVEKIQLNTNNPEKIKELKSSGLKIEKIVPSLGPVLPENRGYLNTKYEKLGHHLASIFQPK